MIDDDDPDADDTAAPKVRMKTGGRAQGRADLTIFEKMELVDRHHAVLKHAALRTHRRNYSLYDAKRGRAIWFYQILGICKTIEGERWHGMIEDSALRVALGEEGKGQVGQDFVRLVALEKRAHASECDGYRSTNPVLETAFLGGLQKPARPENRSS